MVFRSHGTMQSDNLLDVDSMNRNQCTLYVDTVNHEILLDKLTYYGIRGNINNLIRSYLTNRKQYVSIKGHNSELKNVTCGVPQGSCLGPTFFDLYPKQKNVLEKRSILRESVLFLW